MSDSRADDHDLVTAAETAFELPLCNNPTCTRTDHLIGWVRALRHRLDDQQWRRERGAARVTRIVTDEHGRRTLAGVALGDVYRDDRGDLWEVIALCDQPQATFRRVRDQKQVEHVIGCPNMRSQFPKPPLREAA